MAKVYEIYKQMKQQRILGKIQLKIQILKIFCFDILFIFITNSICNPIVLLVLDLLQLFVLPYFYINPIYPHLKSQQILSPYFTNIHPYLFYIRQDITKQNFPVCLLVFSICMLILAILRKKSTNILILLIEGILALLPFVLLRITSQSLNIMKYSLTLKVFGFIFLIFTLIAVALVLVQYKKWIKLFDVIIAILLFCQVNQYAIMGLLGVKIILTIIISTSNYAKYIKISLQSSLLFSLILLIFVQHVLLNYIMIIVLIVISILYASFKVYINFQYKDLGRIKIDQDDQYCTQENYTYNQIKYFQKMNKHINECLQIDCKCRELLKIKDLKQLKKWAPMFRKDQLKIVALYSHTPDAKRLPRRQNYFNQQIQYIQACLETEQPDFFGFIKLHKLHPTTIAEQFKKYSCMKKYSLFLQKSTPKILNMSVVNQTQDTNPFNQLLNLQYQICLLIQKIKLFWKQLLNFNGYNSFEELIQKISDDINKIHGMYEKIQKNYDEKQQADYYYNIFKLLTLHERPSAALIQNHKSKYIMVTRGQVITNITVNITHLLQKNRHQLIGNKYTLLMSQVYANQHSEWVKQYMNSYRPLQQNNFIKPISITPQTIKVVNMIHLLVPSLGSDIDIQGQNSGVNIISLIYQQLQQNDIDDQNDQLVFHMLVCRNTLDIVAFQEIIFDFFDERYTIDNSNKLLRTNLKKIFPNLNKQALLKKVDNSKRLIAKFNKNFFNNQDLGKTKQSIGKYSLAEGSEGPGMLRKSKQKLLHVEEIYNQKNQKLNLMLLRFQTMMQKQQKQNFNKKTSQDLQLDLLKKKTLKNILQTTKQRKIQGKKTYGGLTLCKILLCLSFIFAFTLKIAMFSLFQIKYDNLNEIFQIWNKKSKFYADLQYTQLFFLNFQLGENRIQQMQKCWNYNQQYTDIITVFKQIQDKSFNLKFWEYVNQFQKQETFQKLTIQLNSSFQQLNFIQRLNYIFFYCAAGLIVLNLAFSVAIFLGSLSKSITILSSFLKFDAKQIQNNIKRIEGLETLLQLYDFNENYEQKTMKQLDEEQQQLQSSSPFFKQHNTQSIQSIAKIQPTIKKTKSKKSLFDNKKLNFHVVLNNYFENNNNNVTIGNKQAQQTSLSKISKLSLKPNSSKLRFSKQNKNAKSRQTKTIILNQSISLKPPQQSLSLTQNICKNKCNLIPPISGFILKLLTSITLIMFVSNILSQTQKCVQLKHRLNKQPTMILKIIELQYFGLRKQSDLKLFKYYFDNIQMIASLPSQFDDFRTFITSISTTQKNLCENIDRNIQNQFYLQCRSKYYIFKSGMETVIEFIQQKFRQVSTGVLPANYLRQNNQLTLSIKVVIFIMNIRNQKYLQAYKEYYVKYSQVKFFIRIIYIIVFLICLYLQARQLKYTSQKTKKTQNLFKIVPPFMKSNMEQSHINKQVATIQISR